VLTKDPTVTASGERQSKPADLAALAAMGGVAIFLFFLRLGNFGVIDGSESYYPAAVREMVEAHSYIVPQMNYQIYFSKPIMTFWLLSSAYHMFGVNEFAGRFFGAFFGVALTLAVYAVTRAIGGLRAGLLAGLLFAGSPFVLEYFRISSVDAFFTSFLGLAFCALLMVVSAGKTRWCPAIYVSLALAVLTKGPAALVLFGAGLVVSLVALRPSVSTLRFWFSKLHPLMGTTILLAVAAPWYVAVGLATKWLFLKVFFVYENLGRASGHTNLRAWYWWRYIAVVAAGLIPWSLYLPIVYADTYKSIFKRNHQPQAEHPESAPLLDGKVISVCSALTIILLFTVSKTQMEPYILPAVAPLAIAAALFVQKWADCASGFGRWTLEKLSLAAAVLGPVLAVASLIAAFVVKDQSLPAWTRVALPLVSSVVAAAWIYQVRLAKAGKLMQSAITIASATAILMGTIVAGGMEYWYNKKFTDLHYLCGVLRETHGEIALFNNYRPSVFYYVRRPVNCFYQTKNLVKQPGSHVYLLCRNSEVDRITGDTKIPVTAVEARGEWGIYRADDAYVQPYATLAQTFSTLSISDILTDRLHLGVLTDCLSGGPLWHGKE
jgi:4-amino-4-deoxy-L-arabinose transferase-like glycosyltransferase